jgi:glycosyltransferase involved in cell wall biosynthesis
MKVGIFLPSLRAGGAERAMVNLAEGLIARGIPVDLVLAYRGGPLLSAVPSEVRLVDLGSRRVLWSVRRLARYLDRERPAALLSALDHANLAAIWARRLSGASTRLVISTHSMISMAEKGSVPRRELLIPLLARLFYPQADEVIAVSGAVADDLARKVRLPRGRIRVVYNPVVTPNLLTMAQSPIDHPWIGDGQPPLILAAGRFAPEKDFPTLLRAFQRVIAERPAHLIILGEGAERGRLEALAAQLGIEDALMLPGYTDNPYTYMSRAAVFVLSSVWEGLALVLVEAMACGTPVVSTGCFGGVAELLENGRYGPLVPVGNHQALATAILGVLDSPTSSELLKGRADDFSVDRIVDQYISILLPSRDQT